MRRHSGAESGFVRVFYLRRLIGFFHTLCPPSFTCVRIDYRFLPFSKQRKTAEFVTFLIKDIERARKVDEQFPHSQCLVFKDLFHKNGVVYKLLTFCG